MCKYTQEFLDYCVCYITPYQGGINCGHDVVSWARTLLADERLRETEWARLREGVNRKKRFLSGIARIRGGGLPMPEFFGPLFRSAFLVNKKSIFLQKCQYIELLTVFSCPGQLNGCHCQSLIKWVSEWVTFDFSIFRALHSYCRH